MPHLFPGFSGLAFGLGILILVWLVVCMSTQQFTAFAFDAQCKKGSFEKLLPIYLRGGICTWAGSGIYCSVSRVVSISRGWSFALVFRLTADAAGPLRSFYGILFMVFLIFDYESYRHHPNSDTYTRFKYTRNQALGFGALICFCVGYLVVGSSP